MCIFDDRTVRRTGTDGYFHIHSNQRLLFVSGALVNISGKTI